MVELFRNANIDWLGKKKIFIAVTIFLLLLGAVSVQIRGFNLGVDFTGGTLLMVRFKEPPVVSEVRSALSAGGLDTSAVTLQPVVNRPNELIIRAPLLGSSTESERRVDEDKRAIIRSLERLGPEGGQSAAGKVNVNIIDAIGIELELRKGDPLQINDRPFATAHPYRQVGEQIVSFRDGVHKGFLQDI